LKLPDFTGRIVRIQEWNTGTATEILVARDLSAPGRSAVFG